MPAFPERSASGSEKPQVPRSQSAPEPLDPNTLDATHSDLRAQYGLKAVPLTSYEWDGYRYTNARDAIAAAKRGASE